MDEKTKKLTLAVKEFVACFDHATLFLETETYYTLEETKEVGRKYTIQSDAPIARLKNALKAIEDDLPPTG